MVPLVAELRVGGIGRVAMLLLLADECPLLVELRLIHLHVPHPRVMQCPRVKTQAKAQLRHPVFGRAHQTSCLPNAAALCQVLRDVDDLLGRHAAVPQRRALALGELLTARPAPQHAPSAPALAPTEDKVAQPVRALVRAVRVDAAQLRNGGLQRRQRVVSKGTLRRWSTVAGHGASVAPLGAGSRKLPESPPLRRGCPERGTRPSILSATKRLSVVKAASRR